MGRTPIGSYLPIAVSLLLVAGGLVMGRASFAGAGGGVLMLNGHVEGQDSAVLANAGGRVVAVRFHEGDVVKAGQILAILSDEEIRAREDRAEAAARAAAAFGQAAHDSLGQLREIQPDPSDPQIAQQQADLARAGAVYDQARRQLAEAQANRRDLLVAAPFDGLVSNRLADEGEYVPAGTAVVTVIDPNRIYVRGFVPAAQIGRVRVGQRAQVYLGAKRNWRIDARVSAIDTAAAGSLQGIRLQFDGAIGGIQPGMAAKADIWTR